jgi:hypothetical protein
VSEDAATIIRASQLKPLNPGQQRAISLMNSSTAMHTCLVGGSRSGKTALAVRCIIQRALKSTSPSRHLMTRFRGNAVRASVWLDTYPKVLRMWFPGVKSVPHRQDGFEELPGGSQIWFGGLDESDRVEKILGQEYATIYPGECSQIPYSSIQVLRTRLAQSDTGLKLRGLYDLNPTSTLHWTNIEFGDKRDPISGLPLRNPGNFQRMFINPEDNRDNLDPEYLQGLQDMSEQYRQRFYEGKYVVDIDGALWTSDILELSREEAVVPDASGSKLADFRRIAVAVDPSGAQSKADIKSDEIGIVAAGRRHNNTATVLEDATMKGSPKEWGRAAVACYKKWKADVIVAEANYGGEMVRSTIQAVDPNVPVKLVHASRGKVVRAEPVAALYEENKVGHAGRFNKMEEQMCLFSTSGYKGDRSPDRADANVWALTELMLGEQSTYTLEHVR